jgi:ribonucleoside-diphosphate reductase alpha chain
MRDQYLGTYSSYIGSPMYNGELQFDMWLSETDKSETKVNDSLNDWTTLRTQIKMYGIRNSLLVAPMPTASTSQILGNYECFEPVMSNIYTRRVLSGEYMVLNDYLVRDLNIFNLWSDDMRENLIKNDGSVQNIDGIPQMIKDRYKTAWELKQKHIIDMAADRGKFICQSQSLNLFMEAPNFSKLSSMHFYAWKKGLKTGMYYLRSRPSSKAIQFTVAPEVCENCSA